MPGFGRRLLCCVGSSEDDDSNGRKQPSGNARLVGPASTLSDADPVRESVREGLSRRLSAPPRHSFSFPRRASIQRNDSAMIVRTGLRELSRESHSTPMTPAQRLKLRVAVQTVKVSGLGRRGLPVSEHGVCPVLQPSSEGALVRQRHRSIVALDSPGVSCKQRSLSASRTVERTCSFDERLIDDHAPEGGMHMDMWTVRTPSTLVLSCESGEGEGHYSPDMQACTSSPAQTPPSVPSSPRANSAPLMVGQRGVPPPAPACSASTTPRST